MLPQIQIGQRRKLVMQIALPTAFIMPKPHLTAIMNPITNPHIKLFLKRKNRLPNARNIISLLLKHAVIPISFWPFNRNEKGHQTFRPLPAENGNFVSMNERENHWLQRERERLKSWICSVDRSSLPAVVKHCTLSLPSLVALLPSGQLEVEEMS